MRETRSNIHEPVLSLSKRLSVLSFSSIVILIATLTRASAEPAKYYVPPAQFSAAFQVMDMGFSNIFGLFKSAIGSFAYDESAKTISHVRFALDADSMMTANGGNQQDLWILFDPHSYPEITFQALADAPFKDGKADIKGTLTVHGVSKPFAFEATMNHAGKSPHGGGLWNDEGPALGLSLRGSFKRADFGMGDPPETQSRFGETVTLMLETQALRQ